MKILLSTPPGSTTELWPPLGLLYIAENIRRNRKDDVRVIDAYCENLSKTALIERVLKDRPDVFGMNCSTHTFLNTIETLREIREKSPGTVLVLGGFHATFATERILREYPFVDYIIKGEGEHAFLDFLQCLEDGKKPSNVIGMSYLDNGSWVDNPIALIEDLDSLLFPARDLADKVEYGYYHGNIKLTFGKFTTLCTSRGCPFKCTYCSCAAFSLRKWRTRSAENVVDEIESLYNQGFECCVIVDDNFTHKHKRVEEICDLIRSRKIKMQFYCEGRVDNAPYALMKKMKDAGFNVIYFGVESAAQHVLDYYNKTITEQKAIAAVENAKKARMIVVTSFIFGAPVESLEDMQKTIDFIEKVRPHAIQINILDCLIGTPIWEDLQRQGVLKPDDWKTNHRIYEYQGNGFSKEKLEELVDLAYSAHMDAWKNRSGLSEFMKIALNNSTARKIIIGNILNPEARKRISEGAQHPNSK